MSKIHISLVGGQPMPVYLGIMDETPDKIILICSESSQRQANSISNAIKTKTGKICKLVFFPPANFVEIKIRLKLLDSEYTEKDELTVNISGGSKPWSLLFNEYFSNISNANCVFIDQNNNRWNTRNNDVRKIDYIPDINEIFELNGTKVKSHKTLADYKEDDFKAIRQIRDIRNKNPKAFHEIIDQLKESTIGKYHNCSIEWDYSSQDFHCEFKDRYGREFVKDIWSPNIRDVIMNTHWFELEVAKFLSKWEYAQDIWLNCEFTVDKSQNNTTFNEIDIIVNTGEKLLFVECKTQVYHSIDIDKFNNAVKNYGGLAAKRIFITDNEMETNSADKCVNAEIPYFPFQEIKKSQANEKLFFEFLSKELKVINKK